MVAAVAVDDDRVARAPYVVTRRPSAAMVGLAEDRTKDADAADKELNRLNADMDAVDDNMMVV